MIKRLMKYTLALALGLLSVLSLAAQEKLSLKEAIDLALKNNYDILLRSNQIQIAKNNVSLANAGILPAINGNLSNNHTIQNSKQTLANGTQQQQDNAKNMNTNYGISLNWKIFDGFAMFANYSRLQKLQQAGELTFRMTVENTIADIITTYFDLARQNQQIRSLQTALEISQIRLKNSESRFKIGKASKLEVLAAKVDLNTDTTNLLRQLDNYKNTQTLFNELLSRDIQTKFTLADSISIQSDLTFSQLQNNAESKNPELLQASINQQIARLNQKQIRASRLPGVNITTGYNFTNSSSALGFAREASGRGVNYGLTASIPLFNGFLQTRNEKNAALAVDNSLLQYKQTQQRVNAQLSISYQTYKTNLELVRLEKQNQEIAKQNLEISLEKFRLGSLSAVEFREAQLNYLNAYARYSDALFQAKQAEISLKQIAGILSF
ncbi:MAG: TolC family protein [Sphingobacteriaceae bacterium]